MPKRTNAEWRELDERLAREVMGLCKWDELPEAARQTYWRIVEKEPEGWSLETYNRRQWWFVFVNESGCPWADYSIREWQPHMAVTQALSVLDRIAKIRRHGHSIFLLAPHLTRYRVLIWEGFGCVGIWRGEHASRAKAICLAIKAYLDAQKEAQDEPG